MVNNNDNNNNNNNNNNNGGRLSLRLEDKFRGRYRTPPLNQHRAPCDIP